MRDADVRASVLKMLADQHAGDRATRIVEEMGVWSGYARIDVAVINGELTGYEIKSDRDTLGRLPSQATLYGRVFDRVVLVVGKKHVQAAKKVVPRWWGITVAKLGPGGVGLTPQRTPKTNPSIDSYLLAKLLWRQEAIEALAAKNLAAGWRSKSVDDLHQRLASELPVSELASIVRSALKERSAWLGKPICNQ
ncbi:sce7726 family protein [Reyranella soli]|uniref:Sce7726 family protein n=1 Tax=Reyranella soli TaxID=1230389 RepID=A0A512N6Q5_9HYPH|nr:sce7726 family protein [Reyranella soli]GEP54648.1 hypothetical protein RSO01_18140 [Reyranella soli]